MTEADLLDQILDGVNGKSGASHLDAPQATSSEVLGDLFMDMPMLLIGSAKKGTTKDTAAPGCIVSGLAGPMKRLGPGRSSHPTDAALTASRMQGTPARLNPSGFGGDSSTMSSGKMKGTPARINACNFASDSSSASSVGSATSARISAGDFGSASSAASSTGLGAATRISPSDFGSASSAASTGGVMQGTPARLDACDFGSGDAHLASNHGASSDEKPRLNCKAFMSDPSGKSCVARSGGRTNPGRVKKITFAMDLEESDIPHNRLTFRGRGGGGRATGIEAMLRGGDFTDFGGEAPAPEGRISGTKEARDEFAPPARRDLPEASTKPMPKRTAVKGRVAARNLDDILSSADFGDVAGASSSGDSLPPPPVEAADEAVADSDSAGEEGKEAVANVDSAGEEEGKRSEGMSASMASLSTVACDGSDSSSSDSCSDSSSSSSSSSSSDTAVAVESPAGAVGSSAPMTSAPLSGPPSGLVEGEASPPPAAPLDEAAAVSPPLPAAAAWDVVSSAPASPLGRAMLQPRPPQVPRSERAASKPAGAVRWRRTVRPSSSVSRPASSSSSPSPSEDERMSTSSA